MTCHCAKATTVHLGIIGPDTAFRGYTSELLDDYGFVVDGDSYTAWGEPLGSAEEPLHVTWSTDDFGDYGVKEGVLAVRSLLVEIVNISDFRVVDYVVLTDQDDWSEDVQIVGAYA